VRKSPYTPRVNVPEVKYARNGEVSIAYQVVGEGPRDLTFVTGFVGHLELFWEAALVRRFFERLSSFSRLILWDKREQGLSDRLGQPPTLEQGMDDLAAVLDAAGSEHTALFGISEGGPMSILYAASFPHRVSHLALYGTYPKVTASDDYPAGVRRDLFERWLEQTVSGWGGPGGLEVFAPSVSGDAEVSAWWARLLRSGTSPRAAAALMRMYMDIDVRPALPAITAPTLVLHRSGDRLVRVDNGRALAEAIPQARYVELDGADHLAFAGDQDALLDEVEEFITGVRREHEPERVLATVLFTDIVSSTERAAATGDREWRGILERHDELVRKELVRFRGREIKQTGDGFLAAFDGPARAVQCAASITDHVRPLGIEVRAGVHTGECELRAGDIAGIAVHIGARVGARAGAGEVLVSRTVKDLVTGSGLQFQERGPAELKGVPGDWHLYALDRG
jgi:class 3 adenylate cyclase